MRPATGTDNLVPVHGDFLAMLLLANASEKGSNFPFQGAIEDQVKAGIGAALIVVDLDGQSRFVAGRDLGAAETATLEVVTVKV